MVNSHTLSLCRFCSRLVTTWPHSQVTRLIGHTCEWANSLARLICSAQRLHPISISVQVFACSFAKSKVNSDPHARHSHFRGASTLLAKMFRMNIVTGWRHIAQDILADVFKVSTQEPQKVCPQGVAISASRTGLWLYLN